MREKNLIAVSIVLFLVIASMLIFSYIKSLEEAIPIKSSWYLYGKQNCQEVGRSNVSYSFLCGDKAIDIYYLNGSIVNNLYSAKADINEEEAIAIANYFLDFSQNLGCNLNSIQFYNQTEVFPELKRGEEPPDFAYFLNFGCKGFNMSVTVSRDREFVEMGKVYALFHIDKDKVGQFAESVLNSKSFYFEPAAFKCKKYIIFDDRVDFMDCKFGVRATIFTFKVSPSELIYVGGSAYVE